MVLTTLLFVADRPVQSAPAAGPHYLPDLALCVGDRRVVFVFLKAYAY